MAQILNGRINWVDFYVQLTKMGRFDGIIGDVYFFNVTLEDRIIYPELAGSKQVLLSLIIGTNKHQVEVM